MIKRSILVSIPILLIFPLLFVIPDETPSQKCAKCHGNSEEFKEWRLSKHSQSLKTLKEKGVKSRSCYRCHSTRIEIPSDWSSGMRYAVSDDPVSCYSCHRHDSGLPHNLKLPYDKLCASCHIKSCACQGAGVIHQSHTELFYGRGGYGVSNMPSVHLRMMRKGCVECHMNRVQSPPEEGVRKVGGHTFRSGYKVCLKCHQNPQRRADEAKGELQELLDELKEALDESPHKDSLDWKRAKYNYDFVKAERSLGIHNYSYSKALLKHSLSLVSQLMWRK
ncbi:hypothetical protein J7M22_03910 [Candidatus Poribacteria bacterium]|nr:hypothetical protein [Candidatus Poribacteria bacterium]